MNAFGAMVIELIIGFTALFLFTKIVGKVQMSQITPFDFVSALILGELLGNAIYDEDVDLWNVLFATAIWGLLVYGTTMLTQKYKGLRKTLEGEPAIVIRQGQLQYKSLKKSKVDINQLQSMIRQMGCFSLQEVEYAIIETNGKVSVLKKSDHDTPTRKDLSLPRQPVLLPVTLVIDGELIMDNLREADKTEQWLMDRLQEQGIHSYSEVLYAEWNRKDDSRIFIQKY